MLQLPIATEISKGLLQLQQYFGTFNNNVVNKLLILNTVSSNSTKLHSHKHAWIPGDTPRVLGCWIMYLFHVLFCVCFRHGGRRCCSVL